MSNPTINDVIIIFLKDDLKEKPIAIGLFDSIFGLVEMCLFPCARLLRGHSD